MKTYKVKMQKIKKIGIGFYKPNKICIPKA